MTTKIRAGISVAPQCCQLHLCDVTNKLRLSNACVHESADCLFGEYGSTA